MTTRAPNPWDRPLPIPETSASSRPEIHTAVGSALTSWEELENSLALLFSNITGMTQEMSLSIYGSMPSSNSKRSLIRITGETRFKGKSIELKFFSRLIGLVDKFGKRRTDIAHGMAVDVKSGALLIPPFHIGKDRDFETMQWDYAFDAEHIKGYEINFGFLRTEVEAGIHLLMEDIHIITLPQTPLSQHLEPARTHLRNMRRLPELGPPP